VAADHTTAIFAAQLILLLLVGRALGEIMNRYGQPALFGQLLAGVLLGPSVFGALLPELREIVFPDTPKLKAMLGAVSEVGVLLLLMMTGMETNLALVNRQRRAVISTSLCGIAVPFSLGVALVYALPAEVLPVPESRLVTALFLGIALSISSVKIVAMVLMEIGAIRRDLGQLILATAILDDTLAWIIIAIIAGIATHGTVSLTGVGVSLLGVAAFLIFSLTIGRHLVARLIVWVNDHMTIEVPVITAILIVTLTLALSTDLLGVHTALGAFVAGILIGQSPILTEHIEGQVRGFIVAFFSPVFFAVAGLGMDLTTLFEPTLLLFTLAVVLVASLGKFGGAMLGGRLGGLSTMQSLALGTGLNARGSTEVIIASVGLSMGALSDQLYTMIVAMAVITTMVMPPTLRWIMARVPLGEDELKRLENEAAEEFDNVPKMERVLVYVDESPNGRLAAALAGLFCAHRQLLATVLSASPTREETGLPIADGTLVQAKPSLDDESLEKEIAKGYDLAFIGVDRPIASGTRGFEDRVQHLVASFDGPVAIAVNGAGAAGPADVPFDILVPASGRQETRLATEVALTLAKASEGSIAALHVFVPQDEAASLRGRTRRLGMSVLVDVHRLGKRLGVAVKGLTATNARPEAEIRRAVRHGSFDLVVLGTSLRQGEKKFLGPRTATLLGAIRTPALLIAR
jgi:Kef-type K+ transport system membrane component KefB/nucleotide-binding universal stress UspA family protein